MLLGVEGFQGDLHEGSGDSVASFDMCLTGRYGDFRITGLGNESCRQGYSKATGHRIREPNTR